MDYCSTGNYFGTDIRISSKVEGNGPIYSIHAITLEAPEYIQVPDCIQRDVILLFDSERKRFLNAELLFECNAQVQNAYTGDAELMNAIYEACLELGDRFYERIKEQMARVAKTDIVMPILHSKEQVKPERLEERVLSEAAQSINL